MLTFTPMAAMLFVLGVVAFAIAVREVTEYSPESPARLWTTRGAVGIIMLWFTSGLLMAMRHGGWGVLLSRSFGRGVLAIVLLCIVFRDEL
jgi:hypothetical protein